MDDDRPAKGTSVHTPRPRDQTDSKQLWDDVQRAYQKAYGKKDETAFQTEAFVLKRALLRFVEQTGERYSVEGFVGLGASGLVFKVLDTRLHTFRALKLARPVQGREQLIEELLEAEIGTLQQFSHPNVMPIYDRDVVAFGDLRLPYYLMAFVEGGINAKDFLTTPRSREDLLHVIYSVVLGVCHLHEKNVLHLDIKPSNFLVAPDGNALLADFGSAKRLDGSRDEETRVTFTRTYAHPDLKSQAAVTADSNRLRNTIRRSKLGFRFDLYALGKSIFELLSLFDEKSPHALDPYGRKYMTLMAARLLDGRNDSTEVALALPASVFEEISYKHINEVRIDLEKLTGSFRLEHEIPELAPATDSYIQASTLAHTVFSERVRLLLQEPLLRRLATVSQLGLLNLVYPTASHTRLQHVLGTFTNTAQYLYHLYQDPQNPFFRQVMTTEDLTSTLVASLLHDLGHYPLAHDLQDCSEVVFAHERLTSTLLKGERVAFAPLTEPLITNLRKYWNVDAGRVVGILAANPTRLAEPLKDRLLHTLISGPIDSDKLDYLVRDGRECQVPYARVIDWNRLLRTLTVVYESQGSGLFIALGIHEKGRTAAECVAFARYAMFSQVYWHHTARSAKAMLHRAAWEWLLKKGDNDKRKTELYRFVLELKSEKSEEPALLAIADSAIGDRSSWTAISPGDRAVLKWLYARTGEVGRQLIDHILERKLYKRLAVISQHQSADLWRTLQRAHREHHSDPEIMVRLAKALHERLRDHVKREVQQGAKLTTTDADQSAVDRAIDVLQGEWTVLIDIPSPRIGSHHKLYYMPEAEHRYRKEQPGRPVGLEDSRVWKLLAEELHELAGKIRVFVHPDIGLLGRTVLSQATVETALKNAASEVLG